MIPADNACGHAIHLIGASMWVLMCLALLVGCKRTALTPDAEGGLSADVTAFVGVSVVPMTDTGGVLYDQTVLIRGDRIATIGPRAQVRVPTKARRIDGSGQYLIPGLADLHVHLEHFEDPGVLRLFLANGVTTIRNMDGRAYILDWRNDIADGELLGPTIFTAGPLLDGDPPIFPDNRVVRSEAEAREMVVAQASAGYDFIKVYINLSPEAYRAALAAAKEQGLPVAGHVPRRVDLAEALIGGQVSIA